MKKIKFIILIVLAGLMVLYITVRFRNKSEYLFPEGLLATSQYIEIDDNSSQIRMKKKLGKWYIVYKQKEIPGDTYKIKNFIQVLGTCKIYQETGTAKDVWETLGVDRGNGVRINIKGKGWSKTIIVGNKVPGSSHVFLRINSSIKTFEVDSPGTEIYKKPFYWMDLRILPKRVTQEKILSLIFIKANQSYSLVREIQNDQSIWMLKTSQWTAVLNTKRIAILLLSITNMKGNAVIAENKDNGAFIGSLTVILDNKTKYVLTFYSGSDGEMYVNTPSLPFFFTITKADYSSVFPGPLELLND